MRKLETKVRQQKDIIKLAKNSGDGVLSREAQAKIRDVEKKIREIKDKYSEVAEASGLKERRDKMVVGSYKPLAKMSQEGGGTMAPPSKYDGDFSDFEELNLTKTEETTFRELASSSKKSGFEYGAIIQSDKSGTLFTSKDANGVKFDKSALKPGSHLLHSHTNGSPLSIQDLSLLIDERVESIGNISYNGDVYRAFVGYGIRPEKFEYDLISSKIAVQVNDELRYDPDFDFWTKQERNYMAIREQMYRIAREFGWKIEGGRID